MQIPYSVSSKDITDPLNKTFVTKNGIVYTLFFAKFSNFNQYDELADTIYSFGFTSSQSEKFTTDTRIALTIQKTVSNFISKDKVVLFTYDNQDGRALSRKRLFNIWALNYKEFKKIDYEFDCYDEYGNKEILYASMIVNSTFPHMKSLNKASNELFDELKNSKD